MFVEIALLAYVVDRVFGEFKSLKHPVIFMGEFITWFESRFYQNSIISGWLLTMSLLILVFVASFIIVYYIDNIVILAAIASTGLASKMLYDSVKNVIQDPQSIKYLVSRDTDNLSNSDINKAAIETYAENLSDGVIAPLCYLVFFGIVGLFIYKAINTLDSMVGYRNKRYENFGKFSAKLDDVVNYIPARITFILIAILTLDWKAFQDGLKYGALHSSPNAGYPIAAMAGNLKISLGGPTSYFGRLVNKPYFGNGERNITTKHIKTCLSLRTRLDALIFLLGALWVGL